MDGWSQATLVRTGFGRYDEGGNLVSIWNFGELDNILGEIDSERYSRFGPVIAVFDIDEAISNVIPAEEMLMENEELLEWWQLRFPRVIHSSLINPGVGYDDMPPLENSTMLADFYAELPNLEPYTARSEYSNRSSARAAILWKKLGDLVPAMDDNLFQVFLICVKIAATVVIMHELRFKLELPEQMTIDFSNAILRIWEAFYTCK
ncbi:hypothetical protein KC19_VG214700 [Ceratodon purpureus]|uniref:Uncharacterized protein n=1 Tax=Ceratodon purpureus TaxID=3225 RepID=A0A8T0HSS2_CERPU|nr:hypothetical protein KC19_VG214700 [Ceratodon purpureus]